MLYMMILSFGSPGCCFASFFRLFYFLPVRARGDEYYAVVPVYGALIVEVHFPDAEGFCEFLVTAHSAEQFVTEYCKEREKPNCALEDDYEEHRGEGSADVPGGYAGDHPVQYAGFFHGGRVRGWSI